MLSGADTNESRARGAAAVKRSSTRWGLLLRLTAAASGRETTFAAGGSVINR